MDIPFFINLTFKIDSKAMARLAINDTKFMMVDGTIVVTSTDQRNGIQDKTYEPAPKGDQTNMGHDNIEFNDHNMDLNVMSDLKNPHMNIYNQNIDSLTVSEKFKVFENDEILLNLDDPLLSIEPRHDFIRFLSQMDPKTTVCLEVLANGTLICKINDYIEYEYKQVGCKVPLSNIDGINIRFKTEEIVFLKDLMDTTIIFCIFDECLIIYSYEQNSTLAVQIPLLL